MVAQGEGRSPKTSSDAETDSKPIISIYYYVYTALTLSWQLRSRLSHVSIEKDTEFLLAKLMARISRAEILGSICL